MAMKSAARREKRARAEVAVMRGRGAKVKSANEAVIVRGKRAKVGKGNAAEAKNADVAALEVENVDSEAAIEVHILVQNSTVLSEGRLVCLTASN